jgi:LuxR family maltose regulon positive regulatory protein
VLASRREPALPLARLRAEGRLVEVRMHELSMSEREAKALLQGAGVELPDDDIAKLTRRTEGWPAGLYLAALSLRASAGAGRPAASFRGDDRFVSDYFRLELLSHLPAADLAFLTRTAVLDRMCGLLCDAVLEARDSDAELRALERSNLFLIPLDHERRWYRFHHLFREMLADELARREPGLVSELNSRAADWWEARGEVEAAIDYAGAAGDSERVLALVGAAAEPAYHSGRIATTERWFARLDDEALLERQPAIAVLGAWMHAWSGRPEAAERWARAADRGPAGAVMADGSPVGGWIASLRAAFCRDGVERMRQDAEAAAQSLGARSAAKATAVCLHGVAQLLAGEEALADETLAEAVELAAAAAATDMASLALAERSLLATERGDSAAAASLAEQALAIVEDARLDDYATSAIAYAAAARAALRHSSWTRALDDIERASRLLPLLTHAVPWLAVQVRLELVRAQLALVDGGRAAQLLDEVDELVARRPDLGVLLTHAEDLRRQVAEAQQDDGWASSLTGAELRLLPLLTTHLSFREIADELVISRNTVKTQAISVYRKLGVSSRSDAIARAVDLGLVGTPLRPSA